MAIENGNFHDRRLICKNRCAPTQLKQGFPPFQYPLAKTRDKPMGRQWPTGIYVWYMIPLIGFSAVQLETWPGLWLVLYCLTRLPCLVWVVVSVFNIWPKECPNGERHHLTRSLTQLIHITWLEWVKWVKSSGRPCCPWEYRVVLVTPCRPDTISNATTACIETKPSHQLMTLGL